MRITLDSDEIEIAKLASQSWDTKNWGRAGYNGGLLNSARDPRRTERLGIIGQIAFGKAMNREVDLSYKRGGDDYDDVVLGQTIDVKLSQRNYGCGFVTSTKSGDSMMSFKDIYVFSYLESESDSHASVKIQGIKSFVNFKLNWLTPARRGTHYNWEVPFRDLVPIEQLIDLWQKDPESEQVSYRIITPS